MRFDDAQSLVKEFKLSRDAIEFGDELVVFESIPDDGVIRLGGGVAALISVSSGDYEVLGSSPLGWPMWVFDGRGNDISLH